MHPVGFSAFNCLLDSQCSLLTSQILGRCIKLKWSNRAYAVYWLCGTLLCPCEAQLQLNHSQVAPKTDGLGSGLKNPGVPVKGTKERPQEAGHLGVSNKGTKEALKPQGSHLKAPQSRPQGSTSKGDSKVTPKARQWIPQASQVATSWPHLLPRWILGVKQKWICPNYSNSKNCWNHKNLL